MIIILGGKMFIVKAKGDFQSWCPVKDFNNGTYISNCFVYTVKCTTIIIKLQHQQYASFWNLSPCPIEKVIYQKQFCPGNDFPIFKEKPYMKCDKIQFIPGEYIHDRWQRIDNKWRWVSGTCVHDNRYHIQKWKDCINSYTSVTVLGDSHARAIYKYILTPVLTNNTYHLIKLKDHEVGHIAYKTAQFGKVYFKHFKENKYIFNRN